MPRLPLLLSVPILSTALALGACGREPAAEPAAPAEPLPADVCARVGEAKGAAVASGLLTLNAPTDAIVAQDAWVPLSQERKAAILDMIGLAAVCAGEPRLEQEVVVHNEYGDVLARRVVKTSFSTAEALRGLD